MTKSNPDGLTRDTGWQMGARRTFPVAPGRAWEWLLSTAGLAAWLGEGARLDLVSGARYALPDAAAREQRLAHFQAVQSQLEAILG